MINIIIIISNYKIKIKSNKILDKTLNKTFNKIHEINIHDENKFLSKIIINQKIIFLLKNKITIKKIIFILNMIIIIIISTFFYCNSIECCWLMYIERKSLRWTNSLLLWFNCVLLFYLLQYYFEASWDSALSRTDENLEISVYYLFI